MKVVDLLGNTSIWKIRGEADNKRTCSNLHVRTRELLKEVFPVSQFKEEVPILIRPKETLFFDFYCHLHNLAIEVHGEQHFKFVMMYHQNAQGFARQNRNDEDKQRWCELNNIKLVILPYNEGIDEWRIRLKDSLKG